MTRNRKSTIGNFSNQNARVRSRARRAGQVIALAFSLYALFLGWGIPSPAATQLPRGLFLAYGPADFVRGAGAPTSDTRTFSVLNSPTEYRLQIFNGGMNSQFGRASSAVVTVNGQKIVSPSDFNQNAGLIERQFTSTATNSLTVELRSAPKSGLTVQVVGVDNDAPVINVVSPVNGTVVSEQMLTVTGTIDDPISGVASVTCGGTPATVSGSSFSCDQTLIEGANEIIVEATDRAGNNASTVINVTWNPVVPEEEQGDIPSARLTPDVIFVGETQQVNVSARIPYGVAAGAPQVTLQRIDAAGSLLGIEGVLVDNGDASQGDLLSGDGVFSFRRPYAAANVEQLRFRVSYQQNGSELKSKTLRLGFYDRLTNAQIDAILLTQQSAAQSYVDLSASVGEEQARATVLAQLRQNPSVITAGLSTDNNTIAVLYTPGIAGAIYLHQPGTRGGGSGGPAASNQSIVAPLRSRSLAMPSAATLETSDDEDEETHIESRRALILSPFHFQFAPDDENGEIAQLLEGMSCPSYEVTSLADQQTSVDSFKNLDQYGIIAIISHGITLWQGIFPPAGGFHGLPLGLEVYGLVTSEKATPATVTQRQFDLVSGRVALVTWDPTTTYFAVLPTFISYYSPGEFPNSLVYLGTCFSAANDTMARAFTGQGADTYLGYTKEVSTGWARLVSLDFFERFLGDPLTTTGGADGAYTPEQYDIYPCLKRDGTIRSACNTPERMERVRRLEGAKFKMIGSEELLQPNLLLNGGFETGDLDGWGFARDSRVLSQLGDIRPVSGNYMGMVAKIDTWFGLLVQEFCLPAEATRIEFDWNLITEQTCGSFNFNPDELWIRFQRPGLYHNLLKTGVREQCSKLGPTTVDFPSPGGARATGWQHASIDIADVAQSINSENVELRFEVLRAIFNGNLTTDSAILIDNVKIVR
ncbi:MAG TPA: hypothetical protein VIT19_04180 [Pyrinomonadaceae bacterium]